MLKRINKKIKKGGYNNTGEPKLTVKERRILFDKKALLDTIKNKAFVLNKIRESLNNPQNNNYISDDLKNFYNDNINYDNNTNTYSLKNDNIDLKKANKILEKLDEKTIGKKMVNTGIINTNLDLNNIKEQLNKITLQIEENVNKIKEEINNLQPPVSSSSFNLVGGKLRINRKSKKL
jgi:hypothetical protein